MTTNKLEVSDRVRRKEMRGCLGRVKDIRAEVTLSAADTKEKALLVSVQWDNGTLSYFTPDALEKVEE